MEEIDLMKLVVEMDDELIKEGAEPFQRAPLVCFRLTQRLRGGTVSFLENVPLLDAAVNQIYRELYRPSDLYMPPMHVGAFMFRDVFFPLRIPVICGRLTVNPSDFLTDVPDIPKDGYLIISKLA
ncbi:MAG: hypothetical protein HC881_22120 [Leptolyngbyaceae cyanobacterium SL_7_1]|nr:hypothetical protein [Leptolyngbyaceae cyanobacterium SL_7_1]